MGGRRAEHEPGDPQDGLDAVTHGFRSSFRDYAAEQTDTPYAVMEAALAHTIEHKAEGRGKDLHRAVVSQFEMRTDPLWWIVTSSLHGFAR